MRLSIPRGFSVEHHATSAAGAPARCHLLWPRLPQQRPRTGPSRYFTGSDCSVSRVGERSADQPRRTTIAYVRQSNDVMTDKARPTIWLVDVATGQQRPLIAGIRLRISRRAGRPTARVSLISPPRAASRNSTCAGWAPAESARITGLPDSPSASPGRPTGAGSLTRCSFPTKRRSSARSAQARRGEMGRAAPGHRPVTYRFDAAGYLKSGYRPDFLGPRRWRRADAADVRSDQCRWRTSAWTRRRALHPVQRQPVSPTGSASRCRAKSIASSIDGGAPVALTSRDGPDNSPVVSPDGRYIAWVGFDDKQLGYQNSGCRS